MQLTSNAAPVEATLHALATAVDTVGRTSHRLAVDRATVLLRGRVHVRTGKTRASIRVSSVNQYTSTLVASYGAVWEEARGGDHAFFSLSRTQLEQEIGLAFREAIATKIAAAR